MQAETWHVEQQKNPYQGHGIFACLVGFTGENREQRIYSGSEVVLFLRLYPVGVEF